MKLSEERKQQISGELHFSASRSSGPGGQNVNKVNSKVELRFAVNLSKFLSEEEKERILKVLKKRINLENELIITVQSERSQLANREKALQLFFSLIESALTIPKKRKKTVPTQASRLKRLESKKIIALKKQLRKPPKI
ncbi:MAG: aminoacyl-tRNA hydrolase [Draconibacterium sp.]|nr:MAG: aminoacyl-tRNA hydrolase [Draconibacterium sp.]PIF05044.1 MAG: aminoacyl-tRNA hydrolase [Draconibacterium sp.]